MMLDEPVSALDLQHQMQLMEHLHAKTRANDWVTIVVLHDLNLAAQFADQLIVLADGQLQAFGHPRDVLDAGLISGSIRCLSNFIMIVTDYLYIRSVRRVSQIA